MREWIQKNKNKKSNNKTPKITHHPKTKRPMLQIVQKQNTQIKKTPKITKSPNLQNVPNYKMSKVIKYPKLQLFDFLLFLCSFDLFYNIIDKVLNIDATLHRFLFLCGLKILTNKLTTKLQNVQR